MCTACLCHKKACQIVQQHSTKAFNIFELDLSRNNMKILLPNSSAFLFFQPLPLAVWTCCCYKAWLHLSRWRGKRKLNETDFIIIPQPSRGCCRSPNVFTVMWQDPCSRQTKDSVHLNMPELLPSFFFFFFWGCTQVLPKSTAQLQLQQQHFSQGHTKAAPKWLSPAQSHCRSTWPAFPAALLFHVRGTLLLVCACCMPHPIPSIPSSLTSSVLTGWT